MQMVARRAVWRSPGGGSGRYGFRRYAGRVDDLSIQPGVVIPARELSERFARSSGAGGQHVNKVSTKVELRWVPGQSEALRAADRRWLLTQLAGRLTTRGELVVTSEKTRDQTRNREDARQKLADLVRRALRRPTRRKATRPGRGARERRLRDKRQQSEKKQQRRAPVD